MAMAMSGNPGIARRQPNNKRTGESNQLFGPNNAMNNNESSTYARLFLVAACIWPLCLLALFASSAPHVHHKNLISMSDGFQKENVRHKFRDVLDRVDIMGYGPTHPRIAVVLVGNDRANLISTLESVFANTDLNRIFVVCIVVDGKDEDPDLAEELEKIDAGAIPHWHGFRPDLHSPGQKNDEAEDDPHGKKVYVMFNKEKLGLAQSRKDAVDFIRLLEIQHESHGLKSEEEDLILLLLQSGSQLTSRKWLGPVTEALIVPPPILGKGDNLVSLKLANAISFNLEGSGKRTSFDATFTPVIGEPNAADITLSNGASYPAPALNGAAVAMRLHTYLNLPMQDMSLEQTWAANLDLALNLWLCADGIDVLKDVDVTSFEQIPEAPLPPEMAARFAAAWMDDVTQRKFFKLYTKSYNELTHLEWRTYQAKARTADGFTPDLARKCRSFMWYAENINPELYDLTLESDEVWEEPQPQPAVQKTEPAPFQLKSQSDLAANASENVLRHKTDADIPNKPLEIKEEERLAQEANLPDHPLPIPDSNEDGDENTIPERHDKMKPSKPLCEECLNIVQKAQQINIAYEDVRTTPAEHPHMGARDEQGNWGYIHDVTSLRKNPPTFNFTGNKLENACAKRDNNWRMLNEKVFVDLKYDKEMQESGKKRGNIFCLVYTTSNAHDRIPGIRETWGPKCDGFLVGSNKTDPLIDAVDIPHKGEEEYGNIWQKVRSMWAYIYDNYYEQYDWFHIGGDDLFLIVENLKYYLESEEIRTAANGGIYLPDGTETMQTPLFLGRRFAYMGDMNEIFNSGGSGYTMNKAALKTLVVKGFPTLFPNLHTFSEDTMVARVLKHFGVLPYETKDEMGGERYMPFMPGHHYGYRMPEDHSKDWYAKYSINIKEGVDHCAARSVAFHYVKGESMKRLYALLYHLCPTETQ